MNLLLDHICDKGINLLPFKIYICTTATLEIHQQPPSMRNMKINIKHVARKNAKF
jgi:hypothetical protein